jgi:PAS domain S-box-containing protein
MTFLAGLIPVIIFTVLINIHGKRIEKEVTRVIENGYKLDTARSEAMLREIGETSMYSQTLETARQLDRVVESVPWMTLSDLRGDRRFRSLAVQPIGQTGYTYLFETKTGIVRFHRDRRIEGRDLRRLFRSSPEFLAILKAGMKGQRSAHGYFRLAAGGGTIIEKYLCIVPLHNPTGDGIRLMMAATINADDFSTRIRESQEIHDTTKRFLTAASNQSILSFRQRGLLFMGIGILTVSLLSAIMGIYFSKAVRRLREATTRINAGDFSTPLPVSGSSEVATLMRDFNRMVDQLATTTVSRQLLQASEGRLKVANSELRREISERERTEEALAAEKERLSVTLRSIGEGFITADSEGRVVLVNSIAESLTGWTQEEASGLLLSEVFSIVNDGPQYPSSNGDSPARVMDLRNPLNRKRLIARDGTEKSIVETSTPIGDKNGIILGTVIIFRDITDQKKLEEELLRARKLESLGVLAGGIAHDFNNLLAVILGNISFGKMFMKPEEKAYGRLVEAENACLRGKDLTYQLLAFARGGEPLRNITDLGELVENTVKECLGESRIRPSFSLSTDLRAVRIDEAQICQVIERIVNNAVEAMGEEGLIEVGVENFPVGPGSAIALDPGDYVRIRIRDNGPGIPGEDLPRIFDPYFTKKQMGNQKGTGLGLSISYSVVKDHGGLITVESSLGLGTAFDIYLPSDDGERVVELESYALLTEAAPVKGKLLFMDDDEGVRDVIVGMLIHLGYNVQFAREGGEAIVYYKEAAERGEPFDAVVADLTVQGGMGGKELIRQLQLIDPGVKAVISSGYSNDPVLHDFRNYGFLGVVAKPYKVEDLCLVLDRVIQSKLSVGS